MALFHKKPDTGTSAPLYSLGLNKTVLLVGLGNPGKKYDGTRHNIGFDCLDFLQKQYDWTTWLKKTDLHCQLTSNTLGDTRVIAIKPTTYMNDSGLAVQLTAMYYKVLPRDILVIHDELDLPFGQIRTKVGGGDAGHNGIKSISEHIDDHFGRIRIGVANQKSAIIDSADFVLGKFDKKEQGELPHLRKEVASVAVQAITDGSLRPETVNWLI